MARARGGRAGTVRTIGMSNFLRSDLEDLLEHAEAVPHVNQLLVHAGNTPRELLDFCEAKGIRVQAYSPIAHGAILENPEVNAMAERYGVSVPQLCIRCTLQLGTVSLPKTANPERMRANAQVNFEISVEDMAALEGLEARDYGEHSAFPVFSGKGGSGGRRPVGPRPTFAP